MGLFRHTILPLDGNASAAALIQGSAAILPRPEARKGPLFALALRSLLKSVRPRLLLTYNWGAIDAALAAQIGFICPVIHNESGFGTDEAGGLKMRRVIARRLVLNRVYGTVVNSRTLLQIALTRYKLQPGKVHFIRNGVDSARFQPGRNAGLRAGLGATDGDILFGFVGRHRAEKNLSLLVEAFAKVNLARGKLLLFGDGPCRRDLELLTMRLGIAGRVIFPGHTEDPSHSLQALDVFVMSSVTEQTPNALLEAMSSGLPAISTDVGDARELLDASGAPVIVPSGDVGAYAAALDAMARDAEARARIGAANRARSLELYSLDRMVSSFGELWDKAATPVFN